MKITLGFGSTEVEQRKNVYNWIFENIKQKFENRQDKDSSSLEGDVYKNFKKDFDEYQRKISEEYEKADKSETKLERYFHINYGVRMAVDYDTIFVSINFWHINSRHALSPDGMALMQQKETFTICSEEF